MSPDALLLLVVYVAMLAGLLAILVVPFFPGLLVVTLGLLAYVGYASYTAHALSGMGIVPLVAIVVLTVIGLSSSWWSERLELRFTYIAQPALWGAFIGSFIGLFIAGTGGLLLGMVIGVTLVEMRTGRKLRESLRQGAASLMSMLGPRGFQFLMALWVVSIELATLQFQG
ncbi:MAG TPA: DUF456 domain-containing protein [Oscillatoriaceae cyanobacterium]